jgi:hypothetical protein
MIKIDAKIKNDKYLRNLRMGEYTRIPSCYQYF